MASDTLSISKDLRAAGFNEQQADALASHMAAMPSNPVTKEDLALEVSRLDHKIDQVQSRLLLSLGAGLAVAVGLILAGMGTVTAVLLNQLG